MAALYYSTPIDGGVDFHVIEFDATISEKHTQDATLTEHAIGSGGNVSDHSAQTRKRFPLRSLFRTYRTQ